MVCQRQTRVFLVLKGGCHFEGQKRHKKSGPDRSRIRFVICIIQNYRPSQSYIRSGKEDKTETLHSGCDSNLFI